MSDQIYTQDWQEYQMERTIPNEHLKIVTGYAPQPFIGVKWVKKNGWHEVIFMDKESEAICIAQLASLILPKDVLRIIKLFWMQDYYSKKEHYISINLELRFKKLLDVVQMDREVFVMGDVFYPRARGYCLKCGEPVRKPPPLKFDRMIRYKLHPRLVQFMRLCYGCCSMGFNCDEERGLEFPDMLKCKMIESYRYYCAYPKCITHINNV